MGAPRRAHRRHRFDTMVPMPIPWYAGRHTHRFSLHPLGAAGCGRGSVDPGDASDETLRLALDVVRKVMATRTTKVRLTDSLKFPPAPRPAGVPTGRGAKRRQADDGGSRVASSAANDFLDRRGLVVVPPFLAHTLLLLRRAGDDDGELRLGTRIRRPILFVRCNRREPVRFRELRVPQRGQLVVENPTSPGAIAAASMPSIVRFSPEFDGGDGAMWDSVRVA